jgi:hypothetical protein
VIKQSILDEGYLLAEALKHTRIVQSSSPATPAMALLVSCLVGEREGWRDIMRAIQVAG